MYRDLQNNEVLVAAHEIIQSLALENESIARFEFDPVPIDDIDEYAAPESLCSILDADASQRQAILAAQAGKSFIMDGPPGTGKSQTIANIIAELLSQEKSILFVSEKAAALEVVYKRLAETKLDDFILELHSHKATRKEVAKQLGRSLLNHPVAPSGMPPDAISRLTTRRKELSDYATALNEKRYPIERTLHDILGIVSKLQSLPQSPHPKIDPKKLSAELLGDMIGATELISRSWKPIDGQDRFFWRDLADSELTAARKVALGRLLESTVRALDDLERISRSICRDLSLDDPTDISYILALQRIEGLLSVRPDIVRNWLVIEDLSPLNNRANDLRDLAVALKTHQGELEQKAGARWREIEPTIREPYIKTIAGISANSPTKGVDGGNRLAELNLQATFFENTVNILAELGSLIPELASIFEDKAETWTLDRISKLAQIGAMTAQPHLPEKTWVDLSQVRKLRDAATRCRNAVLEYKGFAGNLEETFLPSVLGLSLETICVRFERIYKSFRFFNKRYWQDKKLLSAHCVTGKFRKREHLMLRNALGWKKSKENLDYVGRIDGQQLGATYWRALDTDFTALESALDVAEKAATLAGLDFNIERIQNLLSHNGSRSPRLLPLTGKIEGLIEGWRRESDKERVQEYWLMNLDKGLGTASNLHRDYLQLCKFVGDITSLLDLDLDLSTLTSILDNRLKVSDLETQFSESYQKDCELLGETYQGPETDWKCLDTNIGWANELREIFKSPLAEEVAASIISASPREEEISQGVRSWGARCEEIRGLFEAAKGEEVSSTLNRSLLEIRQYLANLIETIDDIGIWDSFSQAKRELEALGLDIPLEYCIAERVDHTLVPNVIMRSILEVWIDDILRSDIRLKHLSAGDRDFFVKEFCKLDKELIKRSTSRVIDKCNSLRPRTTAGASGIILREAEKQRRHMPIRSLIERTAPVVQAIKPCFMMSPLSVSQYLPPTIRFDYVIFDEASQVKPADAINCIYRGNNLIVAGDQKQLPPTTFFERTSESDDDSYDEESPDQFQSILDKCKATGAMSSIPLCWHYRSQHEELIAFSNYSFYDHRLVTFPCSQKEASDLGIELFHVANGIYRRGTSRDNYEEAIKVADRVRFHCERHPQCSVGVVAFSEAQAFLVETLIQQEAARSPHVRTKMTDDRLNGIFIKNLETVQGDERDIIIFSIGYGKDEFGKFTLNFGPINKPEGWRRLNVAITRARRRIEVVSSILPEDFPADIANRNVAFLRKYLEYAAAKDDRLKVLAMEERVDDVACESHFEEEVARVIRSWGYAATPQVGCAEYRIDLGIGLSSVPAKYILGVECDGAMYHSSRVARDRDRLRQEVLEGLGWTLYRIWGPSWYRHRSQQEELLKRELEKAAKRAKSADQSEDLFRLQREDDGKGEEADCPKETATNVIDLDRHPSWAETYKIAKPDRSYFGYSRYEVHDSLARPLLDSLIKKIIMVEEPVHINRIVRAIKDAWGIERAGGRVTEAIIGSLSRLHIPHKGPIHGHPFSATRVRLPSPDDPKTERIVEEVPAEEIALAMTNLISDAKAIPKDELVRAVARLFGWERCGDSIKKKLLKILSKLPGVTEEGGNLVLINGREHSPNK
jgi:very-short-patch-repair endonuclease